MSRFAPVGPLSIMSALDEAGTLGEYQLILAHQVLEDESGWKEFYRGDPRRARHRAGFPRPFVVLDNSLVELGAPLPTERLLKACSIVQPSVLVLPDVFLDGAKTADMSEACAEEMDRHHRFGGPWSPNYMGVLQGSTEGEVLECCARLIRKVSRLSYVSLPRVLTGKLGSRVGIAWRVYRQFGLPIHLLGFSDDLPDDIQSARLPFVTGIDSAVPVWSGLCCQYRFPHHVEDISVPLTKRPPHYNSWDTSWAEFGPELAIACGNIQRVRDWIR